LHQPVANALQSGRYSPTVCKGGEAQPEGFWEREGGKFLELENGSESMGFGVEK
ncbi:hypothetical protein AVEN_120434-1, partial [Araneus ventricosus]